ncbi:MAG: VacJ family lipoprotein [Xanthomonadaceae bacterium]|nr:VacJ family lipoprotein [Xanthomonadaceae bacterium]
MNLFRLSTVVLLAALATACASAPKPSADAPAEAVVIDSTANAAAPLPPEPPIDPASIDAPASATDVATASEGEDDFAAIYGQGAYDPVADPNLPPPAQSPVAYDPWEKFNRKVHAFNNAVDRAVARPLARAYVAAVPRPVRLGVGNFFDNLRQPLTMVNQLLQGRPRDATQTFGRFLLNSTVGIGGIFDPASDLKMKRRSEDFGQTLGTWGWRRSRYVELPFFGPRTVRDVLGLAGDMPLSPTRYVEDDKTRIFLQGLNLVDTRAQLLSLDSLREGAVDDYALVRDSWLQRRNYQIESHRSTKPSTEDELPEYLQDENTPTVPADAMPMPEINGG